MSCNTCNTKKGGFSFCGVNIKYLDLEYAPEKEDTYVYAPGKANVHDETFDGHNGGYFYGVTKEPKEFKLRCYFENEAIDRGIMAQMYDLFRAGRSGQLIFDRRPWCAYYATVTEVPTIELSNYKNGMVTINMKAYYPYARSVLRNTDEMVNDPKTAFYVNTTDPDYSEIMLNTGLFDNKKYIPQMSFVPKDGATSISVMDPFILSNPGTEYASVGIYCAGQAPDGIVITNKTTGQQCKLVAFTAEKTSDDHKYIYIDGISGKTTLENEDGTPGKLAFLYHDSGFIDLAPCFPVYRNLYARYTGDKNVTITNKIFADVEGKYIFLNKKWHKIESKVDDNTLVLKTNVGASGIDQTIIAPMNELIVMPISSMALTKISFVYKPTFA